MIGPVPDFGYSSPLWQLNDELEEEKVYYYECHACKTTFKATASQARGGCDCGSGHIHKMGVVRRGRTPKRYA